ncbi:MAG: hypothetical protein D6761_12540 [Candidatus Dadabacteria bacterium]|nr:MAG: hypothetical protein D6761_12540 [Candidatus Dadabacteria bacterium]
MRRKTVIIEWVERGVRRMQRWDGEPIVVGSDPGCALQIANTAIPGRAIRLKRTSRDRAIVERIGQGQHGQPDIASVEMIRIPGVVVVGPVALRLGGAARRPLWLPLCCALPGLAVLGHRPAPVPSAPANAAVATVPRLPPDALAAWAAAQERAAAFEPGALGRAWVAWCALRETPAWASQAPDRCEQIEQRWYERRRVLVRQVIRARQQRDETAAHLALERLRREAEPFGDPVVQQLSGRAGGGTR